jgi:hypothetical protein
MRRQNLKQCFLLLCFLGAAATAQAGTELDFWHSYTHQPSGAVHFSFHIANYKRGLFFGSCGPSTRSLQWEYDMDLAGPGPRYTSEQITVTREGKRVVVAAGTISVDPKQRHATIDLRTAPGNSQTAAVDFVGNGTHRIHRLK